ncbi:nucleolar protein 6 [Agrilus planipennis]|uniref:Nucleolar protein 6 n=1 Tax=Agrilus planipennis TaxID=224129 RepID=A0A7F5RG53_AGRPL|nr:nucleolar protein 6 [Agrilus planipennis]
MSKVDENSSEEEGFELVKHSEEELSDLENEESSEESSSTNENSSLKRKLHSEDDKNKRIKKHKDLYKPPTTEELNRLHENENLFNSNLFRMQIEELLNEIKVKHKYVAIFESWYEKFQGFIKNIPEYDFEKTKAPNKPKKKKEAKHTSLQEIESNLCGNCKSDHSKVTAFIKPSNVDIFGRYRINAVVGTKLEVDIKLIMPKLLFKEKDYLNNRYWIIHNYYISYIATELKKANFCSKISYLLEHNNAFLSKLIVTPFESDKITIKIHVVPQEGSFKNHRFEPQKNNVKVNILQNDFDVNLETLKITATPYYNAAIAKTSVLEKNYNFLEDNLKDLKNVQDGIKLLTVWLKQRFEFNNPIGFTEELLLFVILYLVIKKRVNKHMSSYQVIRNFWYFLSTTDWSEDPISLSEDVKDEHLKQYRKEFDIVFLDNSGYYNLTSFLDKNIYMKIKKESQIAVNLLDKVQFNSFGALFMTKMPYQVQYDAIVIIKNENRFSNASKFISEEKKINYISFHELLLQKTIANFLQKGLGKRIKNLVPQCIESFIKDVGSKTQPEFNKLTFGITLDPEHAYKIVEIGPPADDKDAALEFQKFWGNLAHCRRFNDGSIHEAVHFEAETFHEKRNIFKKIVNFVLSEKLQLKENYMFCNELEKFISPGKSTIEESTIKVITTFDELTKLLRSLALPLGITAIHGKSDVFCYSDLFPPVPTTHNPETDVTTLQNDNIVFKENANVKWIPNYCAPIECVIHLSLHSKWPNDFEALKHIKTAFYLKISELLKEKSNVKSNVRPEFFDVYYKGYVFRFTLYHPKEIKFLKKEVDSTGTISYKDTEDSINYEKELDIACKISGALNGIQSQFSSFGPSNTLIKRWLRSQLIDNFYIPDIVINMLNASIYLNNVHLSNSNLPQVQFLRFLKFIQDSDWNLNAVVVNFNDEITKEQLDSYETNFHQNRQNYPPLYIITPYDNGKSLFTINTCGKEVLRRLAILATATYNVLLESFLQTFEVKLLESIFVPNMDGYNLLIHLKPLLNSRRNESIDECNKKHLKKSKCKNVFTKNYDKFAIPIVGFNPVDLYLSELRANYGEFAYFFHNVYGGCTIAVLWKPNIFDEKEFKVSCVNGHKLKDNKLIFNEEAVIEDFYILGEGLVENIEKKYNDEITKEQLDSYETNFHQNRQNYPPLYIITPYDNGKSLFTINTCGKEVLRRLAILATATYNVLLESFLQTFEVKLLESIFVPNMDGYNLLIHLKPLLNSRRNESIDECNKKHLKKSKCKNVFTKNYDKFAIPIVGFNPVDLYLSELRANYGEFAYFFHNVYGGCTIAVLWKPNIFDEKEFKVSCVNGHKLKDNKLIFNEEAVIEDLYILGEGLVENIEKK